MAHLMFKRNEIAIRYGTDTFPVGRIKQDTLYLDSPSKDKSSNAYGIDKMVLIPLEFAYLYKYIVITIGKTEYITSKRFWGDHGKKIDLGNGRDEIFLPLGLFGIDRVYAYDHYLKVKELADKDIFDVAQTADSWDAIDEWQVAQMIKDEYLSSLKFKVQL